MDTEFQTEEEDTLRVLHLPSYLSNSQRERLLKKYGAIKVRTINRSDKYAVTFAKFPSKHAATQAFLRLHQLEVRGRRFSVEFAKKNLPFEVLGTEDQSSAEVSEQKNKDEPVEPNFRQFIKRLNSWAFSNVLTQPPPPNIRYKYSPATGNTLLRISIQMIKEPAFYCQVLHLMNKMNLPPPFPELEREFPVLRDIYDAERYRDLFGLAATTSKEKEESTESEESELESDDEAETRPREIIPVKRKRAQSGKRLKIPKFVNPTKHTSNTSSASAKATKPEDVFESLQRGESKSLKIALKVDMDLDLEKRGMDVGAAADRSTGHFVSNGQTEGGFGLIYPVNKSSEDAAKQDTTTAEYITSEQLAANRISVNDQRLLPVFKNYHPGRPSCRLYIKNLSKQVELKDLDFIYKKYVTTDDKCKDNDSGYNVRLMQEGRMKGQAFITLQNTEQAQIALDETNGYIFKDKPMVVQFAKIISKPLDP